MSQSPEVKQPCCFLAFLFLFFFFFGKRKTKQKQKNKATYLWIHVQEAPTEKAPAQIRTPSFWAFSATVLAEEVIIDVINYSAGLEQNPLLDCCAAECMLSEHAGSLFSTEASVTLTNTRGDKKKKKNAAGMQAV